MYLLQVTAFFSFNTVLSILRFALAARTGGSMRTLPSHKSPDIEFINNGRHSGDGDYGILFNDRIL